MKNHLENILVSFLDYLKEGLIVIDSNKNIQYMNSYAKNLLGIKNPEGKLFSEVVKNNYLYSLISADIKKELKEEIVINDDIFLARVLNINGMKVIHFQDITPFEIYKQAKKDFVSNVSHELKTPITVLKGVIETLENEEEPEIIKTFLKKAKNRIQQMDSLINDLLILAKLESKEEKIQKKEVKLRGLINSIFEDLKDVAEEKDVKLINKVPTDSTVFVDEKKFVILMKNLIENAIKYNKKEGSVTVESTLKNSKSYISVIDTGIGIPKESLPLIFERFYRVDKSRSRNVGGTGLGLSIVKHIAEAHNGKVQVESKLGEGSKFTVILPSGE
ncbi:GHKL domain-containing protein [Persephonella atlantica]|uniref:histidine kinase n=1 Tax=Persephonella atlantica TaxID=2699429 RepID=A0ABS1GFY1_9AQUI|nr:ATP-binding protein [Persephonella atlantica]MBK3331825.1 GHKL domain-containing protein [Persephonella atlantica]